MENNEEVKPLGVGSKLWHFDVNRRHYKNGNLLYEKCFQEVEIVDEMDDCFVTEFEHEIPKQIVFPYNAGLEGVYHSERSKEEHMWRKVNMLYVEDAVRKASFRQLKKICEVLKYEDRRVKTNG